MAECAQTIFGENVPNFLCSPLEDVYPLIYGHLDVEQKLLLEIGALDLVLIENASEVVNQLKNVPGFIEQVINFVLKDNESSYTSLGSFEFPYVLKNNPHRKDADSYEGSEKSLKYDSVISKVKRKINRKKKKYVLHVAVVFKDKSGHYGTIIKNGRDIVIFDSMEHGYCNDFFQQVAEDVFEIPVKISLGLPNEVCLQPTGGFVYEEHGESDEQKLLRLQEPNSQDHFCYFWAIWFIHIFIRGGTELAKKEIYGIKEKGLKSLVIVKRYIWSILLSLYPTYEKLYQLFREGLETHDISDDVIRYITKFFLFHFRYIWDKLPETDFRKYEIIDCDLKEVQNFHSTNECLEYSLREVIYGVDNYCEEKANYYKEKLGKISLGQVKLMKSPFKFQKNKRRSNGKKKEGKKRKSR